MLKNLIFQGAADSDGGWDEEDVGPSSELAFSASSGLGAMMINACYKTPAAVSSTGKNMV